MTDGAGPDPVYEPIAAFAAGLAAHGVTDVVISPGSRSTPLTLTFHAQPALRTWIQLDERSAGFFALGMAQVTGRPSVLVCTSGTAAANYLPAVVEAHHAGVPMIVCTADRPPELRDWGAGQTIDQVRLYGTATRWAADLPVAGEWTRQQASVAAGRAVITSTGPRPGPVHLNWPLREPLEPVGAVPVAPVTTPDRAAATEPRVAPAAPAAPLDALVGVERGVVVVGPPDGTGLPAEHEDARHILRFARCRGWPVVAEPLTQLRRGLDPAGAVIVATADHLLRGEFAQRMRPEVVVRIGGSPTTKAVRTWVARHRPSHVVLIDPTGHWNDPTFTVTDHVGLPVATALASGSDAEVRRSAWLDEWETADRAAAAAMARIVDDGPLLNALVARTLIDAVPAGSILVTSNSMPVRDLDAFVAVGGPPISVIGNRGASGIDGITSTALGAAATHDGAVVALVGDLALLHDVGALFAAARLGLHLTLVCVDNDGGAIFSMLPIAERGAEVDFETLFRTPHGLDLSTLGGTGGVRTEIIERADVLHQRIRATTTERRPGVDLLVVRVDRDADLAQRAAISAAVAQR